MICRPDRVVCSQDTGSVTLLCILLNNNNRKCRGCSSFSEAAVAERCLMKSISWLPHAFFPLLVIVIVFCKDILGLLSNGTAISIESCDTHLENSCYICIQSPDSVLELSGLVLMPLLLWWTVQSDFCTTKPRALKSATQVARSDNVLRTLSGDQRFLKFVTISMLLPVDK